MPLEVQGHRVPHMKALISGKLEPRGLRCGNTFILCYTLLKRAILLHKIRFVWLVLATTVYVSKIPFQHKGLNVRMCARTAVDGCLHTFAILWSKSAIFRGVWQNVNKQLHLWAPPALIPHFRAFKRGILLCCVSRGSKVTRKSANEKSDLLRKVE